MEVIGKVFRRKRSQESHIRSRAVDKNLFFTEKNPITQSLIMTSFFKLFRQIARFLIKVCKVNFVEARRTTRCGARKWPHI